MSTRSHVAFSVVCIVLWPHGLTALRLEANPLPSCRILDFFEFDGGYKLSSSIRNYNMSELYGPLEGPNNKSWAPSAWAFQSSRLSQSETFTMRSTFDSAGFNQYLLEQVMLAKWQDSGKCCTAEEGTCAGNEDIIIVPSFVLHAHQAIGYKWRIFWESTHKKAIYSYWNAIYTRYYISGRKPLIVTHMSFVWFRPLMVDVLKVLSSSFPREFVDNVVIGGQEAEMRIRDRRQIHNELPILLSLPYPVGIVNAVRFTSRDGSGFDPYRDRPILINFEGDWIRDSDGGELVRPYLRQMFDNYIGSPNKDLHVCRDPGARTDTQHICGLEMEEGFDTSLNSVFCLEPPGDTLTRSHLYVAVLTGCVPVIFDGGHEAYGPRETSWAWRKTNVSQPSPSVDFNSFAVVYKYADRASVDWVQDLKDMPVKHPERLLKLRRGLDNIAPLMRYSPQKSAHDAFDAFVTEVNGIRLNRQ